MINDRKVLAIIPARGGSKGIPNKNIIDVCGKPLIQYTLDEAKNSKYIDEIHISTDCESIISVVRELGFSIERQRPAELAQDDSATIDVLIDVITYYKSIGKDFDVIILLQPTQPLRKAMHIDGALECYIRNSEQGVASVSLVKQHPILMRKIDKTGQLSNILNIESTVRRQDFNDFYIVNGAIYVNNSHEIFARVSLNDNKVPYVMKDDYENIDIDEQKDLERLEQILLGFKRGI
ncbi:CMP-N-acetylneuraminic acid synthetase [Solibacillus silvestris StLB046]|uniref:CMP-N-acetylneuraminic acid synthetase n=2 Tax=Solibacillus silvestris TaxID=76853 RepID=F2F309_SOLSS|nr:CMP-N-acetylneuraminic acid synthetase [Solibacillus silvestris StLB046]